MKEPTEAQIKKFWEWCGFKYHSYGFFEYEDRDTTIEDPYWESPQGHRILSPPKLTLDNLFKYAVPKVNWLYLGKGIMGQYGCEVRIYPNQGIDYTQGYSDYTYNDPALALFWAIWEVIEGDS